MRLLGILILISSFSFLVYGISWFTSSHMKSEFKRFGFEKFGLLVVVLEILGALGLLVGLMFNYILLISSLGLSLLMFLGFLVRLRIKDSLWVSLPVLLYLALNSYIFSQSMQFFFGIGLLNCPITNIMSS